jgi:hypothetical protein
MNLQFPKDENLINEHNNPYTKKLKDLRNADSYSKDFVDIIEQMLKFKVTERPDFIRLKEIIQDAFPDMEIV